MESTKPPFAGEPTRRANGTALHLTLREMRSFVGRPRYWLILGIAFVIAALAGPFYTLERLSFPARLIYWGATAVTSGLLMTFLSLFARRLGAAYGLHWVVLSIIAGFVGTLPIMSMVFVANQVSGLDPGPFEFWSLFPYVSVPVVLITVLVNALIDDSGAPGAPQDNPLETAPAESPEPSASLLFSKLPQSLGRDVVSLQARDHYIEVTTTQGSAMILMRLSDAEQDLQDFDGMRVHRSWWISLAHVQRIEKGTSGPELRLVTGQAVPVSRAQRAAVRDAVATRRS